MHLKKRIESLKATGSILKDAVSRGNLRVLASMLGPAYRGFFKQRAKHEETTLMPVDYAVRFDWQYKREHPEMARLYEAAKSSQWNASVDVDWTIDVDPMNPERQLMPADFFPASELPGYSKLTPKEQALQMYAFMGWMLSQFLHGEQGALYAAAQVTEAVEGLDRKLFGSTQVVDEGRHVEVFHRYLTEKIGKLYMVNDNLYVLLDSLISDSRWDIKFLGMQIMIEGLALGAFGTIRQGTSEPLLKDILKYVITDEARHVHYGVLAIRDCYLNELTARERREREDWAFEVSLLLRNRFMAQEFYDEYYAHAMSRAAWEKLVTGSNLMEHFRRTMFRRIVPNLKRIGLLSARIRPRYEKIGLLAYENERAAPELSAADLLAEA